MNSRALIIIKILSLWLVMALSISSCGGGGGADEAGSPPGGGGGGSASLSWNAVTTNIDGTPATDLAGYRVYYGETSPVTSTNSAILSVGRTTTAEIGGLQIGKTYYFRVSSFNTSGIESPLSSEEVSKTIQ